MSEKIEKQDEEEELLIAVEDDSEDEEDNLESKEPASKSDERIGASENEDEEDDDEDDENDTDEVRARRREERRERRKRQRDAKNRNQKELEFLRNRNEQLERRFSQVEIRQMQSEAQQIDSRLAKVQSDIRLADQVIAKGISANRGEDVVEAQKIRDQLLMEGGRLSNYKQQLSQTTRTAQQPKPQGPDPIVKDYASSFIEEHKWWDPKGGDEDSRIVSAIDNGLVKEGLDPRTQEYWDELDSRVRNRLPHRYSKKVEKKKGGPTFRSGGSERQLKKNEVYISPERKQAMIDAGVWDEPELRSRYLKRYAEYDRENKKSVR
jgi:hypothetical protein